MKLEKILSWIDRVLETEKFEDVSNNGLQLAREGDEIQKVAFAVDGSVKSVQAAVKAGAQLLVVHHGISWGGGIRRITEGAYHVIKAAMDANLALAAYHLPLDANRRVGNNWELARAMGLQRIRPAFSFRGNVIGVIGETKRKSDQMPKELVGICSGGAGEFAVEAKRLGCSRFITGEANWGEMIAAENVGMKMLTLGHYETETYGVKALARLMARELKVKVEFV